MEIYNNLNGTKEKIDTIACSYALLSGLKICSSLFLR